MNIDHRLRIRYRPQASLNAHAETVLKTLFEAHIQSNADIILLTNSSEVRTGHPLTVTQSTSLWFGRVNAPTERFLDECGEALSVSILKTLSD